VHANLTLNLGLRYEWMNPFAESFRRSITGASLFNGTWGLGRSWRLATSLTCHLRWVRDFNVVPAGANFNTANFDPTTNRAFAKPFLAPYTGYNNVTYGEWASSSNYHSLQVTVNRRFARSVQFGMAWTWSKSMDYNSGEGNTVSSLVPVRIWNYGLSDFDRTHILKFNWL